MTGYAASARAAIVALGLSALGAFPAMAQQLIPVDVDRIAAVLKGEGFNANIVYDDLGPPVVKIFSSEVKADVEISVDACDEEGFRCSIIIFAAMFFFTDDNIPAASHEKINDWNENNFGKAFIGDGDTMWITTENTVSGGLTKANLVDMLHWFEGLMLDYTIHIDWQAS